MIRDGIFRTSDLALASVLVMHGWKITELIQEPGSRGRYAEFCFEVGEDEANNKVLLSTLEQYDAAELRVEPREFMVVLKKTREQLYDFTGVDRSRRRVRRASA